MPPKFKDGDVVFAFLWQMGILCSYRRSIWSVYDLHSLLRIALTILIAAFLSALIVGSSLHYKKIVENEWFGYPEEWFPSVSATIGDRYPERSFFMIFIAITSGTC